MKEELKLFIKENLKKERKSILFKSKEIKQFFGNEKVLGSAESCAAPQMEEDAISDDINLGEWIKKNSEYNDFQTTLFKMIDDRKLADADVYNKVHIDRRLFSKIRNDKSYHPSKETILLLGLSLELSEDEIEKLLDSASYSLPRNNHYDLIMRFCFMKGIYKITDVNDLLDEYNCKLFSY